MSTDLLQLARFSLCILNTSPYIIVSLPLQVEAA